VCQPTPRKNVVAREHEVEGETQTTVAGVEQQVNTKMMAALAARMATKI